MSDQKLSDQVVDEELNEVVERSAKVTIHDENLITYIRTHMYTGIIMYMYMYICTVRIPFMQHYNSKYVKVQFFLDIIVSS